jgi:putative salt-induced outer membrane protein YdiY
MNRALIALVAASGILASASAQEKPVAGFKNTLSAGVTMTDGNSRTLQANAAVLSEGEKEKLGAVRAGAEANYGESTVGGGKETTVDNARGFANAKKTISPRTFGYADASALYDRIALIAYRAAAGPGVGAYALKNDRTSLSVEVGPSYVWEEVAGVRAQYPALRVAERLDHAISATAKAWQAAEYLPKAVNPGDYLLNAELGVEAAVNARLNLRLVLQDKYDSTPGERASGESLKSNDLTLIAGVGASL